MSREDRMCRAIKVYGKLLDLSDDAPDLPMSTKQPTLYRICFENPTDLLYYANILIDEEFFKKRIFILDSRTLNNGKESSFYKFIEEQNVVIKDFADYDFTMSCSIPEFLFGEFDDCEENYPEDNIRGIDHGNLCSKLCATLAFYLQHKKYKNATDMVKMLLFLYQSNYVEADMACRFMKPHRVPYHSIEQSLYNVACKKSLLLTMEEYIYSFYGNLGDVPVYKNPNFVQLHKFSMILSKNLDKLRQNEQVWGRFIFEVNACGLPTLQPFKHAPILPALAFPKNYDGYRNMHYAYCTGHAPFCESVVDELNDFVDLYFAASAYYENIKEHERYKNCYRKALMTFII